MHQRGEALPAEGGGAGMRGRFLHRPHDHVVERRGVPRARSRARRGRRRPRRGRRDARTTAIRALAVRCTPSACGKAPQSLFTTTVAPKGVPRVSARERRNCTRCGSSPFSRICTRSRSPTTCAESLSDQASKPVSAAFETTITGGQRERREHRRVGGQHRRDVRRLHRLPGDRLVLERLRLALPGRHAEEMQPHRRVRVGVDARDPGRGLAHADAELLLELAVEGRARVLPGLDLAAGELPVAGIGLALGAAGEEEGAVGPLDDGGGDLGDLRHLRPRAPAPRPT